MTAIQGSAQAAGSQQSPSSPEQPGGGIPYGSYGGSAGGSYGTPGYGAGRHGGSGGGGCSGGTWNGGSNYPGGPTPPRRGKRIRRGLAIGTAGVALAAAAAV